MDRAVTVLFPNEFEPEHGERIHHGIHVHGFQDDDLHFFFTLFTGNPFLSRERVKYPTTTGNMETNDPKSVSFE